MLQSWVAGRWTAPDDEGAPLLDAMTGQEVARLSTRPAPMAAALPYARGVGGPALRALSFPERSALLKAMGTALQARSGELVELSFSTGATRADSAVDVDGGIGTLLAYAARGRKELPAGHVLTDGAAEPIGRSGAFAGQHLLTPRRGAAVQVNAYNFPVWGVLEKLAPAVLAGVPSVVKPAPQTAHVTEHLVRVLAESGLLPDGALQLVLGSPDGLLDDLDGQDSLWFTGSAQTAARLRAHPAVVERGLRFNAETDSLNSCVLGPDGELLDLFVAEVVREMTIKAGQRCTAVRRAFVPRHLLDEAEQALRATLSQVVIGDPRDPTTGMGALVSTEQRDAVCDAVRRITGDSAPVDARRSGALMAPVLLRSDDAERAAVHEVEAFGPVATLLPYDSPPQVVALMARGRGSLVASIVSEDRDVVREVILGAAAFHGRVLVLDRTTAPVSTGHGSPLPGLVHGGPGRAGGGEELGGLRAVHAHLQRTAVQASPDVLTSLTGTFTRGATRTPSDVHPFRRTMRELQVGDTVVTARRTVTAEDVAQFAELTGDTFYAHTDEQAAAANPLFGGIVAHGYLVLSLAAGLFVDPAPGPVLANTGLDRLRFTKPVRPGDSLSATLTCAAKTPRTKDAGEVRWDVQVHDQEGTVVASYELLTMVAGG